MTVTIAKRVLEFRVILKIYKLLKENINHLSSNLYLCIIIPGSSVLVARHPLVGDRLGAEPGGFFL